MIDVDGVSKWYGETRVLVDCSSRVARGEVVVLCGPSGSGKSTLIKCVNGLEPFQRGAITVDGVSAQDVRARLSEHGVNVSVSLVDYARLDLPERGLPDLVRASVHYYNTDEELDRLVTAVPRPAGG